MARVLDPCPSYGAYQRHLRKREDPCEGCEEAHRVYKAQYRARRPRKVLPPLKPCGTTAAYRRHLRHGEKPCDGCRAANARQSASNYGKEEL